MTLQLQEFSVLDCMGISLLYLRDPGWLLSKIDLRMTRMCIYFTASTHTLKTRRAQKR